MTTDSLLRRLSPPPVTVAAVGSGGKTSCLTLLARAFRQRGNTVLLTTTTHMRRTAEACLAADTGLLLRRLEEDGFLFAGAPAPEGKLGPLAPEQYAALAERAEVRLVEADGSRGLPLKMPAAWEPVLPPETGHVLVLAGLSALGRPLRQVCHRWELAVAALDCPGETEVTPPLAARLIRLAYLEPLTARGIPYTVVLNQADAVPAEDAAALLERLATAEGVALSLHAALERLGAPNP